MASYEMGEGFAGVMLRHRGRTGLTQRQLAIAMGVSRGSVQDWEAGLNYPDAQHLQALIVAFLDAGGLTVGSEAIEAEALWAAALRLAPRMQTPFDPVWWAGLLARRAESTVRPGPADHEYRLGNASASAISERRQNWGDAPDVLNFLGRVAELEVLSDRVLEDRCRVVGLLGMGGIGKTMLAARLARDLAPSFERVYWCSVRNAPTPSDWIGGAIAFLSGQRSVPPHGETARLRMLLELLRARRCLLVLDNLEALLKPGDREGNYLDGYAGYGGLLHVLGQSVHQSCLIFTSREAPGELAELSGQRDPVHVHKVEGLSVVEGRALLSDKHLQGDSAAWASLVVRYGGNGLALKIVGETIDQVFGGQIDPFLEESSSYAVFGGIQRLLDSQVQRLSSLEQDVLRWLAIEREPVSFAELVTAMGPTVRRGDVLDSVDALRRRSLVERREPGSTLTLQSAVLGYVTDRLVDRCADEIQRSELALLATHAMVKAQAKDYVRRSQERLIAEPVVTQLLATYGSRQAVEQQLTTLLDQVRRTPIQEHGAAPGNLINLLRLVRGNLRGVDLSGLEIRQAYLQELEAQDAHLENSHFSGAVLGEVFNHPTCVALSEDGTYLAAGTSTGEVCVWRVADRALIGTLRGHTSMVLGVALSANGSLLASADYDGTVRLWDARTGRSQATLAAHVGGAMSVALSQDGLVVASGGYDGSIKVWGALDGRLLMTMPAAHSSGVRGIALSADGRFIASGGLDATVRLWDSNTGRLMTTLRGHTSGVRGVALSADGHLVVSGSEDGTVRLWSFDEVSEDAGPLATLEGHTGCVWSVALAQDGRTLASIGEDGTIRLWDPASGYLLAALPGHTASWGVALSRDGRLVCSSSFEGMVRLWDVPSGRVLATLEGRTGGAWGVAVRADGRSVASGSFDGTVQLWDVASGRLLFSLKGHTGGVRGVALAANANILASSSEDGSVRLWDTRTGCQLRILRGHRGGMRCVALSQDGRLVASGSSDGTVVLWDADSGDVLLTLRGHRGGVWGVSLSGDGQLVASGSEDETVKLWSLADIRPGEGTMLGLNALPFGHLLATLECGMGGVWGVALSGDGRRVASGSEDGILRLWDTSTGHVVARLEGHTGGVWGVAVNTDGCLAASGTFDGTVRIWDVDNGRLSATLEAHAGGVWCVAMSGDGQVVASGSFDGSLRLWNGTTGTSLRTLAGDRRYERMDITGLTGITEAQRGVMRALGAVERV